MTRRSSDAGTDDRDGDAVDWLDLSRRAAFESHRLIGWIFWDPRAIAGYAALGVPDGIGYYVATRGAPLAAAGDHAVIAAFYSIHPGFVTASLDLCRRHTTFADAVRVRDEAVVAGLHETVPEVVAELADLADDLWRAAESLPTSGRVFFASHLDQPRPDDRLLSAWQALNTIREHRGDTHWAIQIAEDVSGPMAGILDNAWRGYETDWIPRSRGADDEALAAAYAELERRGLAEAGAVTPAGIVYRQELEERLDRATIPAWDALGAGPTRRLVELLEPVGDRFIERVDATAGPNWMPAARERWWTREG
jgi:hypothetical protein